MATYGGFGCVDPAQFARECAQGDLPTDRWRGRAGTFTVPLGREPGRGWVLLRSADLAEIDPAADHDLVFVGADRAHVRTLARITLVRTECVDPGSGADPNGVHLCELVDRRHFLARVPIDAGYNVRYADGSGYRAQTLSAGTPHTWQGVVTALATALGVGALTLPFTPHGTPEDFEFYGGSAWHALCAVLDRIACAVEYDPEEDSFAVVRLGAADAAFAFADARLASAKLWDSYAAETARGWRPAAVRVLFRRKPPPSDGSSPYHAETVALAAAEGVVAGTAVTLRDELPALGATGAPSNAALLTARAAERAADWLRRRAGFDRPLARVYRDYQSAAALLGSEVGRVTYDDRGGPFATAVSSEPPPEEVSAACGCECSCDADAASGPPPGPPTGVSTTPGFNAITVNLTTPTGVPPAANYTFLISTSNTFAPNNTFSVTVAAGSPNYTFSNLSSTVIGSSFNNLYVAVRSVSANNTFSTWVTTTEPRPIPNNTFVNTAGTQLTVGWSSNVTFNTGTITITGTQSTNATFSSGSGSPNTVFTFGTTILQGSTVTCSLPANLVDDGSGNFNVLTSGNATNNSTVTCSGATTIALLEVANYSNSDDPLFKFTATSTGTHAFNLDCVSGTGQGTIYVFAGTCVGTPIATCSASDLSPNGCAAASLTSGTDYYIQHERNSGSGTFEFSVASGGC